jgi:hypothetical protein
MARGDSTAHRADREYAQDRAIDLIDIAIGPNHARAALVAAYEGVDNLQQATMDLAESVARELVFQRLQPVDPLGEGHPLASPENPRRLAIRFSRFAVEDAAVRTVAGLDHLANAFLRFAWEANAARVDELKACAFDPAEAEPDSWSSVKDVEKGLARLRKRSLPLLPAFELTEGLERLAGASTVESTRRYRNAVVHRARPQYREMPPFGRQSLWARGGFSVTLRDLEDDRPEAPPDAPTLTERRTMVGNAITEGLAYATELWDFCLRWFPTVGVVIRHDRERDETYITTTVHPGPPKPRFPRDRRDPGPFLRT